MPQPHTSRACCLNEPQAATTLYQVLWIYWLLKVSILGGRHHREQDEGVPGQLRGPGQRPLRDDVKLSQQKDVQRARRVLPSCKEVGQVRCIKLPIYKVIKSSLLKENQR